MQTKDMKDVSDIANKTLKVNIENLDNAVLCGKADDYKSICFSYLLNKYGKEQLYEIIK